MKKTFILLIALLSISFVSPATWGDISSGDDAEVILISPLNNSKATTTNFTFIATGNVTNGANLTNASLWHNGTGTWHLNTTNTIGNISTSNQTTETFSAITLSSGGSTTDQQRGVVIKPTKNLLLINVTKNSGSDANHCSIRSRDNSATIGNGTFVGDDCEVNVDLTSGTEYRVVINSQGSSYDLYRDATGITYPYLSSNGAISVTNGLNSVGDNDTVSWYSAENFIIAEKTPATFKQEEFSQPIFSSGIWNVQFCDDEGQCGFSPLNWTIGSDVLINNTTFNVSSYETATETFLLETTISSGSSITNGRFYYGGVENTATVSTSGTSVNISISKDMEVGVTNNTFFYSFDIDGNNFNTSSEQQNVSQTIFLSCNSTYPTEFLNISFKDESDSSVINASIPTATFVYYLGTGTTNKTLSYTENTNYFNHTFCASPTDRIFNVDPYVQYKQDTTYPQRIWDGGILQLNGTTVTEQTLYLLQLTSGQYVTFQVLNPQEQAVNDVYVVATTSISSVTTEVGSGYTDSAGTVTLFLNPDNSHTFTFTKTGFDTTTTIISPTLTEYTVVLGQGVASENSSIRGINYNTYPINNSLNNDTSYSFEFNLSSSYWDIDEYGFYIRFSNGSTTATSSTTTPETLLSQNVNTGNNSLIYMNYYWIIDGQYINATRYWIVQNTGNTDWSIFSFFTDLDSYIESGMFGLDDFGRNLLIFLILITTTGIMSLKFGSRNQLVVTSMIFSVILLFDVVLNMIPTQSSIPNLPTFLAGVVLLMSILLEVYRR